MVKQCQPTSRWGVAAVIAVTVCATSALGAPTTQNLQGVLRAAGSGPVADGDYILTVGVYAAEKGGAAVWSEPPTIVTVKGGVFQHTLGGSKPLSSAVFKGLSKAWIGVAVGKDPELPRTAIGTVT